MIHNIRKRMFKEEELVEEIIRKTISGKIKWINLAELIKNCEFADNILNGTRFWQKYTDILKRRNYGKNYASSFFSCHNNEIYMFLPIGNAYFLVVEEISSTKVFVIKNLKTLKRIMGVIRYNQGNIDEVVDSLIGQMAIY